MRENLRIFSIENAEYSLFIQAQAGERKQPQYRTAWLLQQLQTNYLVLKLIVPMAVKHIR